MTEPEVLIKTHEFVKGGGLGDISGSRLFTDAHASLLAHGSLAPFQRFTLDLGDFVLHPDLVGQYGDGETIFAIEAKGDSDLLKGLAQAEFYQTGFHQVFLAADSSSLGSRIVDFASQKNIGVLSVGDEVRIAFAPTARMPYRDPYKFIACQMDTVIQVSRGETFQYNIPTHYLVWLAVMEKGCEYVADDLLLMLTPFPVPQDWKSALRGTQKLGLVRFAGTGYMMTDLGAAIRDIVPREISEWVELHRKVASRGSAITLSDSHPGIAAALRILLLQDPMVKLVIEGLGTFADKSAKFVDLARACDRIDHARAPIFFLKPDSAVRIADNRGKIPWEHASPADYRSRMFYQYKSILKHAGILGKSRLGGATAKNYDPAKDVWTLA